MLTTIKNRTTNFPILTGTYLIEIFVESLNLSMFYVNFFLIRKIETIFKFKPIPCR